MMKNSSINRWNRWNQQKPEAACLCALLGAALKQQEFSECQCQALLEGVDQQALFSLARAHAVTPFIFEIWNADSGLPDALRAQLAAAATQTVEHSYRLLFYTKYLVSLLEEQGLVVAVLKGVATAEYYPQPELRKSGDVDLLFFSKEDCAQAVECLKRQGFAICGTAHVHHVAMRGAAGIEVELHSLFVEPFDDEWTNRRVVAYQKAAKKQIHRCDCMGVALPVLTGASHGLSLLLHLLQHFLTAGFGLKLLCDWVVFWEKQTPEVAAEMVDMIRELHVEQFAAAVTGVCVRALGMDGRAAEPFLALGTKEIRNEDYLDVFLCEIIEAEEFGTSDDSRMVALRQNKLSGYVRAFHHQMKLNYPRAGRLAVLFPLLWLFTLMRFLHNNRTLRKTTVVDILKSAGARAKIVEKMHLFERDRRS